MLSARPSLRSLALLNHGPKRLVLSRHLATNELFPPGKYQPGNIIHGYRVDSVTPVEDLQLTAIRLTHLKTQAEHLHLAKEDPNNTFGVMLKTIPRDSTGVAHILEHTALCGSKKYPVRDPFFKMLNRSLANFMNAFTSHDWTMYPFSSQNKKDFSNLLSVYLDAVFYPNLNYMDFRQEGWRLENENLNDPKSPLQFKGIVYNEMKGVMSDPEQVFYTRMQQALLPGTTYHHVSGGDPPVIPDLTYQGLKTFHETFYHPSNAKFFTYGNFPLEDHLRQIDGSVLQNFSAQGAHYDQGPLAKFVQQTEIRVPGPYDTSLPPYYQMSLSFLANQVTDYFETFSLKVLSSLLVGGMSSPFYKALIDSQLGSNFTAGTGYNSDFRDTFFSIGLTNVASQEKVEEVERAIMETLYKLAREGFAPDYIESKLSALELSAKYQKSNAGLEIALGISQDWNCGGDPIEVMKINQLVAKLRQEISKGGFFERKIREYFLDNPHRLKFVMEPEPDHNAKVKAQEDAKLSKVVKGLTEQMKAKTYQEALELQKSQNAEQDLSCLPTVRISDVPEKATLYPPKIQALKSAPLVKTFTNMEPTNGLIHFKARLGFDLPEQLQIYLPLFTKALTWMGTSNRDKFVFTNDVETYTGGISFYPTVTFSPLELNSFTSGITVSSCSLDQNAPKMLELILDSLLNLSDKDSEHLDNLLRMTNSTMLSSLASSGHEYAMSYSTSFFGKGFRLSETFDGSTQMNFLAEAKADETLQQLRLIASHLKKGISLRTHVVAEKQGLQATEKHIENFVASLPCTLPEPGYQTEAFNHPSTHTYVPTPLLIHHVGQSRLTVPYVHPDSAALSVLSKLLTTGFLHREIREKNGAYGGGSIFSPLTGAFSFMSYRDPSFSTTIKSFADSVEWVLSNQFSDRQLEEAKLSVFSAVDSPIEPGARGSRFFETGITPLLEQERRDRLRNVTREQLLEVAARHLQSPTVPSYSTVYGPELGGKDLPQGWILNQRKAS